MSRWGAAFRATLSPHTPADTVDSVDTAAGAAGGEAHSVNSVNSVTPPPAGDMGLLPLACVGAEPLAAALGTGADPELGCKAECLAWAQRQARAGWPGFVTNSVALPPASPEQADAEQLDRAAIEEVDGGTDPARWRLADHMAHAAHLRGLHAAALQHPPSWPGADNVPSPGCWCSCCRGWRWWRDRAPNASGWCCWTCHPPVHLHSAAIMEART